MAKKAKSQTKRSLDRDLNQLGDISKRAQRGVRTSRDALLARLAQSQGRAEDRAGGLNEALGGTAEGLAALVSIPGASADTMANNARAGADIQLRNFKSRLPAQRFRLTNLARTAEDQAAAEQSAREAAVEAARAAAAARSASSSQPSASETRTTQFDTVRANAIRFFEGDFQKAGEALTEKTGDPAYLSIGVQLASEVDAGEAEPTQEEVFGSLLQSGLGLATEIPGILPSAEAPGRGDALMSALGLLGANDEEQVALRNVLSQLFPGLFPETASSTSVPPKAGGATPMRPSSPMDTRGLGF